MEKFHIAEGFTRIDEHWRPNIVASVNDHEVKIVKIKGEFPWHSHDGIDELFFCWKGQFQLQFRDRLVEMRPGDIFTVPRGVEHRPVANEEAEVLLFETTGVLNTGNVIDDTYTAPVGARFEA